MDQTNRERREALIGILFDKENSKPIKLKNDRGTELDFECVFACVQDGQTYCILLPLARVEGKDGSSAFAFRVGEDGSLSAVGSRTSQKVFAKYYETREKRARRSGDGAR